MPSSFFDGMHRITPPPSLERVGAAAHPSPRRRRARRARRRAAGPRRRRSPARTPRGRAGCSVRACVRVVVGIVVVLVVVVVVVVRQRRTKGRGVESNAWQRRATRRSTQRRTQHRPPPPRRDRRFQNTLYGADLPPLSTSPAALRRPRTRSASGAESAAALQVACAQDAQSGAASRRAAASVVRLSADPTPRCDERACATKAARSATPAMDPGEVDHKRRSDQE